MNSDSFPLPVPANSWHLGALAGFDLETTGRNPHEARIVTASLVFLDEDGQIRAESEWLVDPGVEIPEEAAAVHGVTTEKARAEGMDAAEAVEEIADTVADVMAAGIPLVAYNGVYDFTVLAAETARHRVEEFEITGVIDPFILDKQMDRFRKGSRTLSAVSEHFGVRLDDAHTSAADAVAAVEVAKKIVEKYPKLAMPLPQIFAAQKKWKAEQSESFEQYLRRTKDPQATISREWPVESRRN